MGGWKLEVAKMALYLSFPVVAFHVFNTPKYFEQYVIEKKREMYPHESTMYHEEMSELLRDMKSGNLEEKIHKYNAIENKKLNNTTTTISAN